MGLILIILCYFIVVGVLLLSCNKYHSSDKTNTNYSKDYMNNPVVRNMNERNRDL